MLKTAAKPRQIEMWLLMTAYRNSLSAYATVPSATPYDMPFSHNTMYALHTNKRQTTYRTQSSICSATKLHIKLTHSSQKKQENPAVPKEDVLQPMQFLVQY